MPSPPVAPMPTTAEAVSWPPTRWTGMPCQLPARCPAGRISGTRDRDDPIGVEQLGRPRAGADVDQLRRAGARPLRRAPRRSGGARAARAAAARGGPAPSSLGIVGGQLEERVERLQLDAGACCRGRPRRSGRRDRRNPSVRWSRYETRRCDEVAPVDRAARSRRPRCRRRSRRPVPARARRSRPVLHLGDQARPVPAQRAAGIGIGLGLVRVPVDDLEDRRAVPSSTRQTRTEVAPRSTATTAGGTVGLRGRWRPSAVPPLGDRVAAR